MKYKGYIGRVE